MDENGAHSPELRNKGGQEIAKENVEKVRRYIEHLRANNMRLPSRYGKPNWTQIAGNCGLKDRGVFYSNDDARVLIAKAVSDIGLESEQVESKKVARAEKRLDVSERQVQQLAEKLAVKTAEAEASRKRVAELEEKLRHYELFEEVMVTTGRRLIP